MGNVGRSLYSYHPHLQFQHLYFSQVFLPFYFTADLALCPHPSCIPSLPVCIHITAPLIMQCLRHSFQQMERRTRGRVRQREKGEEEEGAVSLASGTPAFVTGKQQGRSSHNGAKKKTPLAAAAAAAPPPPSDEYPQIRPRRFYFLRAQASSPRQAELSQA